MSLSLKQQLNNANTDLNAIESEVNTLKTQTAEAIAFHHNFITSDENIVVLVNRTTTDASNINTIQSTTNSQADEINQFESDISNNSLNIIAINNSFTNTTDLLRTNLNSEISNRTSADTILENSINDLQLITASHTNQISSNDDDIDALQLLTASHTN
jgi:hypothetical protein